MADIDLPNLCVQVRAGKQICISMAGMELCAQGGIDLGDPGKTVRDAMGALNAALTPLGPFFKVLDVLQAIANCVTLVVECFKNPLKIKDLAECVPALAEKLGALLSLLPQIWLPLLIAQILDLVIEVLQELRAEIESQINFAVDLAAAELEAAKPGNFVLAAIVDCEKNNTAITLKNLNESQGPLNRIMGILKTLMDLSGLGLAIPSIGELGEDVHAALAPLDASITALTTLRSAIPLP